MNFLLLICRSLWRFVLVQAELVALCTWLSYFIVFSSCIKDSKSTFLKQQYFHSLVLLELSNKLIFFIQAKVICIQNSFRVDTTKFHRTHFLIYFWSSTIRIIHITKTSVVSAFGRVSTSGFGFCIFAFL